MVFISYSSINFHQADTVRQVLEENGIQCWMAPMSIAPGSDYSLDVPSAIERCDVFLMILSGEAQSSVWVPKELDLALTARKPVIPFQIDRAELTRQFAFRLTNVQRIEAFHSMEKAYREVIGKIRALTGGMPVQAAPEQNAPGGGTMFDLLGIREISELDVAALRKDSRIEQGLSAPIGTDRRGAAVMLDLHEGADGAVGLVAGPAGSGKTELLQTLMLSLALRYTPEEVRFHRIDMKERWYRDPLEGLPHLGESLNSTEPEDAFRFITMLEQEICRRKQVLQEGGFAAVDDYLRRRREDPSLEPMPRLVVLVDEMRELKVEYPDLYRRVCALANRKEAPVTGFCLILATSRVHGLLDDRTELLLRFRLASVSQKDLMGSRDSAPNPGAFYFQSSPFKPVQLIRVADSSEYIGDVPEFQWFFGRMSQKDALIQCIRSCSGM